MSFRSISAARSSARALVFAFALLGPAAAAGQDFGQPADTLRYPYVAALSRMSDERRVYFCAGTLIAPQWILTAAHCFHSPQGHRIGIENLWAQVGAAWLEDVPEAAQVRIERIVIHPGYDPASQANDIALVRLTTIAGPLIAEIATPAPAREAQAATVLGFGSFYEGRLAANATLGSGAPASQVSDRLRQASVALIGPADCAARLGTGGEAIGATRICAGAGARETCVGDSGGPLMVAAAGADRVAGIVSLGSGCATPAPVTVYTRVSAYSAWIADVIAGR